MRLLPRSWQQDRNITRELPRENRALTPPTSGLKQMFLASPVYASTRVITAYKPYSLNGVGSVDKYGIHTSKVGSNPSSIRALNDPSLYRDLNIKLAVSLTSFILNKHPSNAFAAFAATSNGIQVREGITSSNIPSSSFSTLFGAFPSTSNGISSLSYNKPLSIVGRYTYAEVLQKSFASEIVYRFNMDKQTTSVISDILPSMLPRRVFVSGDGTYLPNLSVRETQRIGLVAWYDSRQSYNHALILQMFSNLAR